MTEERIRMELDDWEGYAESVKPVLNCEYITFCSDGFEHHVDLPKRVTEFDMVFTDKPRADSFKIKAENDDVCRIVGVRNYLLETTRICLEHMLLKGLPYFHFEYE